MITPEYCFRPGTTALPFVTVDIEVNTSPARMIVFPEKQWAMTDEQARKWEAEVRRAIDNGDFEPFP